jgi:hypothetical protein
MQPGTWPYPGMRRNRRRWRSRRATAVGARQS